MPKPRVPSAVKLVTGGKPINDSEPAPSRGIGPSSSVLSEYERQIWDEVVGNMYAGVLGEADRFALELMCRLIAEMRLNFEEMPAAKLTQLSTLLGRFGMTPSDRTKITVPKAEKKNSFDV